MKASPDDVRAWAKTHGNDRAVTSKARDEDRVWKQTLLEAENAGATLSHDRPGGVDAGRALHVFRRKGNFGAWRCEICGGSQDLELNHLDGTPNLTPGRQDMKHEDSSRNLLVLCTGCHDRLHEEDRKIEAGKSAPVTGDDDGGGDGSSDED